METSFKRATLADAAEMAHDMRAEDAAEVLASGDYASPQAALEDCILMSGREAWVLRIDGKILAIWGVAPVSLLMGHVVPWALTTRLVDRYPKFFFKASRHAVATLRRRYSVMVNMVDARYARALRWARRLGFEVGPAEPYGSAGLPFHRITMRGV